MKKLLAIVLCLIVCLGLVGCVGDGEYESEAFKSDHECIDGDRFVLMTEYSDCLLYRDVETNVMWVWRQEGTGKWSRAGFSALIDADGNPVVFGKKEQNDAT